MTPSSTPMSEQDDELRSKLDDFRLGDGSYLNPDEKQQLQALIAHHTKEAVARAKAEARKAAFDKIFEMAPKGNFEHWTKQMTANWFVALGRLERELAAPQQSKEDK